PPCLPAPYRICSRLHLCSEGCESVPAEPGPRVEPGSLVFLPTSVIPFPLATPWHHGRSPAPLRPLPADQQPRQPGAGAVGGRGSGAGSLGGGRGLTGHGPPPFGGGRPGAGVRGPRGPARCPRESTGSWGLASAQGGPGAHATVGAARSRGARLA